MNDFGKGMKKKRNDKQSYLINHQPMSNSNQSVILYTRQSSGNNLVDSNGGGNRNNINITPNIQHTKEHQQINVSNVLAEVHQHQTGSLQHNQKEAQPQNKNEQPVVTRDEITQLNGLNDCEQSTSSEENSLNDQNLNCQLQVNRKRNSISQVNGQPNGHINGQIEETEFNSDKSKRNNNRRFSEKDKELNLPLLNGHSKHYHEYDQPADLVPAIIFDQQSRNNCQNTAHLLDTYTHSLNSNGQVRKASCNCNQRSQNGYTRNNCNNIENNEDDSLNDELINERRSLV